jgi:hypothetical protein
VAEERLREKTEGAGKEGADADDEVMREEAVS